MAQQTRDPSSTGQNPWLYGSPSQNSTPGGYVNARSSSVPTQVSTYHPTMAMSLIASPMLNSELSPAVQALLRTLPAWYTIPQDALTRVKGIAPQYQPLALWLIAQQRAAGGAGAFESTLPSQNRQLPTKYDPQNISNLILRASPGEFVLRDAVQEMLYAGTLGPIPGSETVGQRAALAELSGERTPYVPQLQPGGPEVSVPSEPQDPNFQRAAILQGIIGYLFPDSKVAYESGGVIGRALHGVTQAENIVEAPLGYLWRASQSGTPDNPTPSFRQMWTQHIRSSGLQVGMDYAKGAGIVPGSPGYNTTVGLVNFIGDWYLNPVVIAGKLGAGAKLAREVPKGEDIFETYKALQGKPYLTQLNYLANAKTAPDLVFKTPGGLGRIDQGWGIVNRFGGPGSSSAEAALGQYWGSHLPTGAAEHLAQATSKEDFGMRLVATFAPPAAVDTAQAYRNIDRLTAERNVVDEALAGGTADATSVERQMYLTASIKAEEAKLLTPTDPTLYTGEPMLSLPNASVAKRFTSYLDSVAQGATQDSRIAKLLKPIVWLPAKALKAPLGRYALSPAEAIRVPGVPRLNMGAWFNQISHRHVYNWLAAGKEGTRAEGIRNLEAFLQDRGLNPSERRALLGEFLAAKNPQEWSDVMLNRVPAAVKASRLPEWAKTDALTWFDTLKSEGYSGYRTEAYVDAAGIERWIHVPTWTDAAGNPIPSRVSELLDGLMLPKHEAVLDATGFFRRVVLPRFGKRKPAEAWRMWQAAQNNITTVWRDGILLLRSPTVLVRTQLEQALRMPLGADVASMLSNPLRWFNYAVKGDRTFAPHLERIPGTHVPRMRLWQGDVSWADQFLKGDEQSLGLLADNLFYGSRDAKGSPRFTLDSAPGSADRAGALSRKQMQFVHSISSADDRFLATHTPEELVNWYKTDPTGKVYLEQLRPFIERGAVTGDFDTKLAAFAKARKFSLEQGVIGGFDTFRNLIANGSYSVYRRGLPQMVPGAAGGVIEHSLPEMAQNMQSIFDEAAQLRSDAAVIGDATTAANMHAEADALEEELLSELRGIRSGNDRAWKKALASGDIAYLHENAPAWLARQGVVDVRSDEFRRVLEQVAYDDEGKFTTEIWNVDPHIEGRPFQTVADLNTQRKFRNAMYRKLLSTPDRVLSRAPAYRQLADRYTAIFSSRGLDAVAARKAGVAYAKQQTRDLMYDLGTRTSAQYFFRHLAPFLPAYEEILKTWMWNIPMNKGGPILGHAYLAARTSQVVAGLKALGIDPNHPLFLPFLGQVLGRGAEGSFNPTSLNLVLGPNGLSLPGLGPTASLADFLVGRVFKQARPATDWLVQNYDARLWPSNVAHMFYGITGHPAPADYLSPDVQDRIYAEAKDKAMRHAYVELSKEGLKAPNSNDKKYQGKDGQTLFAADAATYMDKVTNRANSDLKHWELMRGLLSTFWPAPVSVSDPYSRSINTLYANLAQVAKGSPEANAMYDAWMADHPDGELYLESTTYLKANAPPGTPTHPDIETFYQQLADGIRVVKSPDDFLAIGMGLVSRTQMLHRLDSNINALSSTPGQPASAADILRNWHDRSHALTAYHAEWDRYLTYNTTFGKYWADTHPVDTATENLYKASDLLAQLEPLFTVNGVRSADYKSVKGQISAALSAAIQASPKDSSTYAQAQGIDWWFNHVYDPAEATLSSLYDKVRQTRIDGDAEGTDKARSDIRSFYDSQKVRTWHGMKMPTLEEWQWGAKHSREQPIAVAGWAMDKPQWLTDFQRSKVGYATGGAASSFADYVATYDRQYYQMRAFIRDTVSTGETARLDALEAQRTQDLAAHAASLGPVAQQMLRLMNATPAERLVQFGHLDGAVQILNQAQAVTDRLIHDDLSPTGDSAEALALKGPVYDQAMRLYRTNSSFRTDVDYIRKAQSKDPAQPDIPWTTLWAELFFGDFPITLNPLPGTNNGPSGPIGGAGGPRQIVPGG